MATIKENCAPTKHTVGATGDIYDDLDTGKRYECKSIYSDSMGVEEYEWKEIEQVIDADPVMDEDVLEPDQPAEEETLVVKEVIDEKKPEQPVNNQQYNPNRNNNRNGYKTQYNKQYRSNNK